MNGERISAAIKVINAPMGSTAPESAPSANAFLRVERNDGSFREVLNGDTDGERKSGRERDGDVSRKPARENDADSHAFGQVVERYREREHRGAFEFCSRTFGSLTAQMQMWRDFIQNI